MYVFTVKSKLGANNVQSTNAKYKDYSILYSLKLKLYMYKKTFFFNKTSSNSYVVHLCNLHSIVKGGYIMQVYEVMLAVSHHINIHANKTSKCTYRAMALQLF